MSRVLECEVKVLEPCQVETVHQLNRRTRTISWGRLMVHLKPLGKHTVFDSLREMLS